MTIKTPESWARMNTLSNSYAKASELAFIDYVNISGKIKNLEVREEELIQMEEQQFFIGVQTIVFAAMCFESAVYDFMAIHLGDKYVADHLDKLDVLSKWVISLKLIFNYDLKKDRAAYSSFKKLIQSRNKLVHHKSEELDFRNIDEQMERILKAEKEFKNDVRNAAKSVIFMSIELESIEGSHSLGLPSYSSVCNPMIELVHPEIKKLISECRQSYCL